MSARAEIVSAAAAARLLLRGLSSNLRVASQQLRRAQPLRCPLRITSYNVCYTKLLRKSVEELKLTVESQKHDGLSGVITGKTADAKTFEINLKRLAEKSTEVGIRIGTFGDRVKSEAIHDKILSKL